MPKSTSRSSLLRQASKLNVEPDAYFNSDLPIDRNPLAQKWITSITEFLENNSLNDASIEISHYERFGGDDFCVTLSGRRPKTDDELLADIESAKQRRLTEIERIKQQKLAAEAAERTEYQRLRKKFEADAHH